MSIELRIQVGPGDIRVALLADGVLQEFFAEPTLGAAGGPLLGDILLGRVARVALGMQAAFVDIGQQQSGFLALREARCLARPDIADPGISDCVREGDAVLVQVVKDPIGEKGARLSASVTLAGRMLVMAPLQSGIMLSRRITDEATRARLFQLGEEMLAAPGLVPGAGFIFRTMALCATPEALLGDALNLAQEWRTIEDARKGARPPATLHHDLGPVERTLRDWARADTVRIRIDDAATVAAARAYCARAMPNALPLIEQSKDSVFAGLEDEIAFLRLPKVPLKSGGWITIETTEALTAIDVNSGRFAASSGLEETSLAVNLEAASQIGRQLRLRGLGGLIVVDFIHMKDPNNADQVLAALHKSFASDRAPVQISAMSEFGIVAITRKRVREPLGRHDGAHCPACHGTGRIPGVEHVALDILRRIEAEARAAPGKEILCEASPAVTDWLSAHDDDVRAALAARGASRIRFSAANFAQEVFDVRPL